ncbi:DsbA family oxidoreductase [Sinobaca qinghaiensis]|uniref:DsbA family oxidoreductase n=1 Tax=Sinobaca qinghaiensis TaxID=342944 RepID=UPI000E7148E7|nr:DsbA family oxidoreductase [Sinobaca qinghaiensis]
MGSAPLNQLVEEKKVEIEWRSFELKPEGVELPPKPEGYMEQARANVKRMSEQYGLDMKWNDKSSHSHYAHEGAKFAEKHGKADAYHDAVFKAQFQEDRNINDISTLTAIAEQAGLDGEAFRLSVENREFEQEIMEDRQIAEQIGITGVPCFIVNQQGVMGAQTYESLQNLLNKE